MATPRYIARKVGDDYVLVRQDASPALNSRNLLIGGGVATLLGLSNRGTLRLLLLGGGIAALGVGLSKLDWNKLVSEQKVRGFSRGPSYQHDRFDSRTAQPPQDEVDEAVMESFPASDPPASMTPTAEP